MPRKKKTASSALPPALRTPIAFHDSPETSLLEMAAPGFPSRGAAVAQAFNANLQIPQEWLEKMLLLLDHYRIAHDDPERWFFLAFALALDHVDGMKIAPNQKKSGAPLEWGPMTLAKLYFEVVDIVQERGLSIKDSCQAILDDPNRRKFYPRSYSAKTLARRYYEAQKDALVKVLERAARSKGEAGRRLVTNILHGEFE